MGYVPQVLEQTDQYVFYKATPSLTKFLQGQHDAKTNPNPQTLVMD